MIYKINQFILIINVDLQVSYSYIHFTVEENTNNK